MVKTTNKNDLLDGFPEPSTTTKVASESEVLADKTHVSEAADPVDV